MNAPLTRLAKRREVHALGTVIDNPHRVRCAAPRLPLAVVGIAKAEAGESLYLYRDVNGLPRALTTAQHYDRRVLRSLVASDEAMWRQLWPSPISGWHAGTLLLAKHCGLPLVHEPAGFPRPLAADTPAAIMAHLKLSRMASELLRGGASRAEAAVIVVRWNRDAGSPLDAGAAGAILAATQRRLTERRRRHG